jgi:hypothetical protein
MPNTDAAFDRPPELSRALAERRATVTEVWRESRRVYLRATGPEGDVFARYTTNPDDEQTLTHEVAVREIVGSDGDLRSPAVLERGPSWLLEQAIAAEPCRGAAAVDTIVAAAAAISRLHLPDGPAPRGYSPLTRLRSAARLVRSPLPLRDLVTARRIFASTELPMVSAHGDFQRHNLLYSSGTLWVVDWELSGRLPAGLDLMKAWATLELDEDRERLFEAAVDLLGERQRGRLEQLRYAMAVTTLAGDLASPRAFDRDTAEADELLRLLPQIRRPR